MAASTTMRLIPYFLLHSFLIQKSHSYHVATASSSPRRIPCGMIRTGALFIPPGTATGRRGRTSSLRSSSNDAIDDDSEEKRRMELVRRLQDAYYSSPSDEEISATANLRPDGVIENLPLWRVGWTELPGRSNVLSVHEGRYTHMFETILRGEEPWYVGHLYLPDGSSSLEGDTEECYKLKSWEVEAQNWGSENVRSAGGIPENSRTAVVGTLLRIIDFRRMSDGKMLLLVQAMERFAVLRPIREQPFSIANVQLLPDEEELRYGMRAEREAPPQFDDGFRMTELVAKKARTRALEKSSRWCKYEFDATAELPVRNDKRDDLVVTDIIGTSLKQCMPFLPYSSTIDPKVLAEGDEEVADSCDDEPLQLQGTNGPEKEVSLENRLVDADILHSRSRLKYDRLPNAQNLTSIDDIEERLWMYIDEFVRIRKLQLLPPKLLSLLPSKKNWPSDFILEDMALRLSEEDSSFIRVHEHYPALRRQRSLSYAAYALIETTTLGQMYRQKLLEIYSTRDRLLDVIDMFENANSHLMGEFL